MSMFRAALAAQGITIAISLDTVIAVTVTEVPACA